MITHPRNIAGSHFRQYLPFIALIGLVMLPRLLNLDVFVGPDELAELGRDNRFALALGQGDLAGTLVGDGKPSVTLMWVNTIGVGIKWLWLQISGGGQSFDGQSFDGQSFDLVVAPDRPFSLWAERRMFLALVSGLQILAAWPLIRIVWDNRIATVTVGLMAIEPLLLAFTRMIRGDALLAGFMLLSVLGALAFVKTGQRRYNWLSGAMGGLVLLTKLSGSVIVPIVILIYAAVALSRYIDQDRQSWRWFIGTATGWAGSLAIVLFGLWPAWWFRPVETFNLLWDKMTFHAIEATDSRAGSYFWGTVHPFGPGPWFYPVLAVLRLTPWLLLGGIVAFGRWLWQAVRLRSIAFAPYTLAILFYTVTYWLTITFPGQKVDRFFVPVIPGLAVLTAIEAVNVADWGKRRLSTTAAQSVWPRLAVISVGLLMVGHVGLYHPLYSTYFNPLIGGPQFWQWALPVGNGEGVDEALNYLSTSTDLTDNALVCGTNFPRCEPFYDGELWQQKYLRSSPRWFEADYALWHIDEQQIGIFPEGVLAYLRRQPQIYVASYHGIDYTWLYAVPKPAYLTGGSKLEGIAVLFGYDIKEKSLTDLSPGDQLKLHLYWQNEGQAAEQQFWWRIVDEEEYIWSEAVARPFPEFEAEASQDGAVVEGEVSLSLPPDTPPGTYYLQAGFASDRGDVGQFALPPWGSSLKVKGVSVGASPPANELNEPLNSALVLRGYDLSRPERTPGETVWVTLYWQTIEQPQEDYVITLYLLDDAEREVTSWSGQPGHNYPTSQWPANTNVRDPWPISLPPTLSSGQYGLRLGLGGPLDSTEPLQVSLGTISIVERKISFDIPPMQFEANHSFGEIAALIGYDLLGNLTPQGAHVKMTLYWQALQKTEQPHTVNVRLVDENGAVLVEQESQPAAGEIATTEWQAGEVVADRHEIDIIGSKPVSVNMEIRLLDATGQPIQSPDSTDAFIVSDIQQMVVWRTSSP